MPLIFYQRLMATMTFSTSEEVYCLYPDLTGKGRTIAGHKPYLGLPISNQEAEQLNLDFGENCERWNENCQTNCPRLDRTLFDSREIGVFRWNRTNKGRAVGWAKQLELRWKLANTCTNPLHRVGEIQ